MLPHTVARPTQSVPGGERVDLGDPEVATGPRPTNRPEALPLSGIVVGGKYRLIAEIGRGGMGSVWRAEHLGWEAPVAVKLMNRDVTEQPEARARFEREVRLAAGLRSPHVVQVLDHGVDEGTRIPFIAMELLEGESLEQRLRRLGRLSPSETLAVVTQLVRALSRAHAAGIVHRDLKPDNVFLVRNDEESVVKILDFGVAKGMVPSLAGGLTRPGRVLGTPFYMSPEQLRGSREIDHRADLWSMSTIACECLTGRRPFEASDFAQLALLLLGNTGRPLPSALGPVPPGFDAWFLRATHPDIAQRFQSARELGRTLATACGVTPGAVIGETLLPTQEFTSEPPSTAPVAQSRSLRFYTSSLWQLPSVRLVAPTLLALLIVGGAFGAWFRFRAAGGGSNAPAAALAPSTQTLALSNAEPPAAGPVVVDPGSSQPAAGAVAPPHAPSPADTSPSAPPAAPSQPAQSAEAAAPPPVQRAPWAVKRSAKPSKSKSAAARHTGKMGDGSARHQAAPAETEAEAPTVEVNGRRIRMTLDPSQ